MSTENPLFETREQYIERRVWNMSPVDAPEDQLTDCKALAEELAAAYAEGRHGSCQLVDSSGVKVPVPEVAVFILKRVAEVLARGDSISTVPVGPELSTEEAANVLSVPHEYLVRLLNEERIPYTGTGEHRRMLVEDVAAFKFKRDRERREGLRELIRMADEVGAYEKQNEMFQNEERINEYRKNRAPA